MSSGRLEIELGGKYTARQQFQQMNADIKAAGKSMKDMGQAGMSVASQIAGAFDLKLNGTLKSSLNIIGEMARGGIWGAMSSIASSAIGFVAEQWNKAKETASKYAEICRSEVVEAIKAVGERFKSTAKDIDNAKASAQDLMNVLNGEVATKSEIKVHQIAVDALQQITDDMTAASKGVVMASAAMEQAEVKAAAAIEQAENNTRLAQENESSARQKREAAEQALVQAQEQRAEFERRAADQGWLQEIETARKKAATVYQNLIALGYDAGGALAIAKGRAVAVAQLEEEYKSELASYNEVKKAEKAASEALESAKLEEISAGQSVTLAKQKEDVARSAAAEQIESSKVKYAEAQAALEKETQARAEAAAKANEQAEKEAEIAAEKAARAEAEKLVAEREAERQLVIDKIKADAIEKDIEYTEWVALATKALEEGYSAETAINLVRLRYKAALEETAKQQEAAAAGAAGAGGVGGTAVDAIAEGVRKGMKGMSVNTNVNTGGVGDGVDQSDEVITLGGLQRDVRNDQREARNHLDAVKQSSNAMKAYISGNMSPDVAAAFEKKMKANGWTSRDIQTATEKALKSQLLTHSQVVEQQKAILAIKKKLEDMGLK